MKKIYPFAAYALATAVTALGSGTVLAQHNTGQDYETDAQTQSAQGDQDGTYSSSTSTTNPGTSQSTKPGNKPEPGVMVTPTDQSSDHAKQAVSQTPAADRANKPDHARTMNHGYMHSVPTDGMQASDLMGTEVKTTSGEDVVGSVTDLIIDKDGQVVAIVVGVDGYQGMAAKDVAIGWDDVTRTGDTDEQELRISVARETLRPAPEYARQD